MRTFIAAISALLLFCGLADAGPRLDEAMAHFQKGCMVKPHSVNASFAYFQKQNGYKAWGPERSRKLGKDKLGRDTAQMRGIFVFRKADKSAALLTSAGFGSVANCLSEFKPDVTWEQFVKIGQSYVAKQPGFDGKIRSRRNGKTLSYNTNVGMFSLVKLNNGSFQIMIARS